MENILASHWIQEELLASHEFLCDHPRGSDHGQTAIVHLFRLHFFEFFWVRGFQAQWIEAKISWHMVGTDTPWLSTQRGIEGVHRECLKNANQNSQNLGGNGTHPIGCVPSLFPTSSLPITLDYLSKGDGDWRQHSLGCPLPTIFWLLRPMANTTATQKVSNGVCWNARYAGTSMLPPKSGWNCSPTRNPRVASIATRPFIAWRDKISQHPEEIQRLSPGQSRFP